VRVLFVSPTLPWPLDAGGRIRTWQLLRHSSEEHEVHLWAIRQPDAPEKAAARVGEVCAELRLFERSAMPLLQRVLAPAPARWFHSAALSEALGRLDPEAFDVIHVDELCETRAVPEALEAHSVVHHHKLDLELARALLEMGRGSRLEVLRWRRLEREAASRFDTHFFCCAPDARRFAERHRAARTAVIENGVDLEAFTPEGGERDRRHLLFVGSLDYAPNLDGLAWFLRSGWRPLRRAIPDLRLSLVGRAPAEELRGPLPDGVERVGPVADVRPWLRRATALLVPLRIGGGTRLKIVEALATECPVVTTAVGAEGLALEGGRHLHLARAPNDLVVAALELLEDPREALRRARAGRERVALRYGWDRLAEKLSEAWGEAARATS